MQKQELFEQLKTTFQQNKQQYGISMGFSQHTINEYCVQLHKKIRIDVGYHPDIFYLAHDTQRDVFEIYTITPITMDYYSMNDEDLSNIFDDIEHETISFEDVPNNDLALFFYDDFLPWFELSNILRKIAWYIDGRNHLSRHYEADIERKGPESYEIGKACLLSKNKQNSYKLTIYETSTHPKLNLTEQEVPKSCFEELHSLTTETYNDIHKMTIRPSSATAKFMNLNNLLNNQCNAYHQSIIKKLQFHKKIFEQNRTPQYS